MADLRIRVGASLDASVEAVFPAIERAAQRARRTVEREFATAVPKAMKTGADKAESEFAKLAAEVEGRGSKMMTPGVKAIADFGREAQTRFKAVGTEFAAMTRVMERELRKQQDAQARAALGIGGGGGGGGGGGAGRTARRVGYGAMRGFAPITPMLSLGGRMAGDIARGAGVSFDAGTMLSSYIARQKTATDIANSGYIPGAAGAAGKLQDAGAITQEASAVAKATAMDPAKALEGLQKFVSVTGDLETGRAVLGDMAKLARATGSNLETVVTASADVSAKLGEIPNKAATINAIMRQLAGQGKLGAVEMRDFAKQLAQVAASAPRYGGSTQANIGEMAILLQEARQLGGAKSASQAGTAVSAFTSQFSKSTVVKNWHKMGITGIRDEAGNLKGPEQLILAALKTTGGNSEKMGTLFNSAQSRRAVAGFETIYSKAGGGDAGLKAVSAEFDRLRKATMTQAEVDDALARSMATAEAKAQNFQNQLQDIADKVATRLIPAMERLAPQIERAAEAFGNFISWATENPGKAIAVALAASVAKAGIETVLRSGVEKMVQAALTNGAGGGAAGKAGAVLGAAGVGVAVGVAASEYIVAKQHAGQVASTANALGMSNIAAGKGGAVETEAAIAVQKGVVAKKRGDLGTVGAGEAALLAIAQLTGQGGTEAKKEIVAEQARDLKLQTEILARLEQHLADIKRQGGGMTPPPVKADQTGRMPVAGPAGR